MKRGKRLRDYEILYDLPRGEYADPGKGGIRTRTIRAGASLEVECFPILRLSQPAERERQRRKSTPAQEKLNLKNARKRVRRLLEANFGPGDYALHLTWDYGFYAAGTMDPAVLRQMWEGSAPTDDRMARDELQKLVRKLRRRIKNLGGDAARIKYLYVLESSGDGREDLPPRYHVHMVLGGLQGLLSREAVEALWPHGFANCDRLSLRGDGLKPLADYITKQRRFHRRWACSRNLKAPDVRVSDRKVSRRRAAQVAMDVLASGAQILEQLYPGYRCTEPPEVRFSDFAPGAWIYARMRRD